MGKAIDITGQRFGKLTVVKKTDKRDSSKAIIWECLCDCGNKREVSGKKLRNGAITSCGCSHNRKGHSGRKAKDRTGVKYGLLTVIETLKDRDESGEILCKCRCDCGNIITVQSKRLGINKFSCGCLKQSIGESRIETLLMENNINFAKEYTFGDLKTDKGGTPRFDFAIFDNSNKLSHLVEFDGAQHYIENAFGKANSLEDNQRRDAIKDKYCLDNNIRLIRIKYNETITLDKLL